MVHHTPLIAMIVSGIGLAFVLGLIAHRLRMPPIVGYLMAGVLVGPATPGFVADPALAQELAEIGVILLMFGVGLHFSLKDLLSVRAIAVPGAVVQIAVATAMGVGLAMWFGWSLGAGLVFGLALSVASTVVLLRALQEKRLVDTERGRIAVGWLIVEDLAMVLTLVLLPAVAGVLGGNNPAAASDPIAQYLNLDIAGVVALTIAKVVAFVAVMLLVGRRAIPWLLHFTAHSGSRELFRLAVLAIALGVAFGAAKLFGVSFALGAFFAGMVMSESDLSHQAANETLPLRDAFAVLFFVSVGMMFDPRSLLTAPMPALATLFVIMIGKSVAAYVIVRAFKYPPATALMISASLAQIGEFSFILAELGVGLDLLPKEGRDLIMVGAILSMLLNPLAFAFAERLRPKIDATPLPPEDRPAPIEKKIEPVHRDEDPHVTQLKDHTVLIGYGRVGSLVGAEMKKLGLPFVVIEDGDRIVAQLRSEGIEVIIGNAARDDILAAAKFTAARRIIIAIPNAFESGQIVMKAHAAKPDITIIARAHSDEEVTHLTALGAEIVIMGEREIANGIVDHLRETARQIN
jgi:CPA2 family monovalent cation:H+ antiporter-2